MRRIYHLVQRAVWEQAPPSPYRAASLATEGFIHCSNGNQVAGSANKFYANKAQVLVLAIDPARLTSPLRDEEGRPGELFPPIYGPINREAVVEVIQLERGADGRWRFDPI
jgi:uncharacterized protein (DUF952 family)